MTRTHLAPLAEERKLFDSGRVFRRSGLYRDSPLLLRSASFSTWSARRHRRAADLSPLLLRSASVSTCIEPTCCDAVRYLALLLRSASFSTCGAALRRTPDGPLTPLAEERERFDRPVSMHTYPLLNFTPFRAVGLEITFRVPPSLSYLYFPFIFRSLGIREPSSRPCHHRAARSSGAGVPDRPRAAAPTCARSHRPGSALPIRSRPARRRWDRSCWYGVCRSGT